MRKTRLCRKCRFLDPEYGGGSGAIARCFHPDFLEIRRIPMEDPVNGRTMITETRSTALCNELNRNYDCGRYRWRGVVRAVLDSF